MFNALMPGEHDWMKGKMPSGQPLQTPQMATPAQAPKKRNPVMNALSAVFEYGAPEAFEAGRQKRMTRDVGNALAGGDYAGAANTYLKGGNIEQGLAVRGMAQEQDTARRQQEAQGIVSLFSNGPEMVNQVAMEDPAGFERMTGMTADEYLQAASRFGDGGAQFAQYALAKAQAELGQGPAAEEAYTLAPGARRFGPDGRLIAENPASEKPQEQWQEYTPPGGIPGLFIKSKQTGEIKRVAGPQSGGIRVGPDGSVQIGGPVDGLGYGTGAKGQESAIAFDSQGNPVVTPSPQQEAYNKALRSVGDFTAQNSIVLEDIDRALQNIDRGFSTGAWAASKDLPIIGGSTPAGELESLITTIQANVGFDKLQSMRENSPTGGALGNVTEKEITFLQAVFGSLRQDTRPENVRYNLTRLREFMAGREQRLREALAADFPSLATTAQRRAGANQQVQDLSELYEFMTPEERALFEGDQ